MESTHARPHMAAAYRWVILGVGTAAQAAFSCISQGLPALGPALRAHYDLSLEEVGLAIASVILGMVTTQLAWGYAADRFSDRWTLGVGLTCCGAALACCAVAPSFLWLVVLLFACGAFGCSTNTATAGAVGRWFGAGQRGLALGIRQSAGPFGGALGAVALPAIAVSLSLGASFVLTGALLVVAAAAAARWLAPPPVEPATQLSAPSGPSPLRSPAIWRITVASSLLIFSQFGFLGFVVVYLHDEQGMPATAAAGVLALVQLLGAAARIGVGRISDRTGRRLSVLRVNVLLIAVGFPLLALCGRGGAGAVLPVLLVVGTAALSWNGLSQVYAIEAVGEGQSGVALGLLNTALCLVAGVAPLLFAALVVQTSWTWAYALLCVPAAAAYLAVSGMADTGWARTAGSRVSRPPSSGAAGAAAPASTAAALTDSR